MAEGDASTLGTLQLDDPAEFRMRFLNYNMANSSRFANLSDLPGHLGPKKFEDTLKEPFADGKPLDLAFCSLVETRASVKEWAEAWNASAKDVGHQLDSVIALSAARASAESTSSAIRGVVEGLAVGYNGNLKTVLAFSGETFEAENGQQLHGRLPETTVMGVPIPNPKKAFTGSSIIAFRHPENFKLVFAGAHFPIEKISEMFEHPGNPLHGAKIALAKVLRKILRRAARRGLVDNSTILILQGDLNSRTVLVDTGKEVVATDLLKEVLRDRALQTAIHQNLPLPSGTWQEVVDCEASSLPVTYKYHDELGKLYTQASDDGDAAPAVTIGDVLEAAKVASGKLVEDSDAYKRIMDAVGPEKLAEWGFVYKEGSFRPFRFPASADRVICWAPLGLAQRLKWELPQGGYKVLHSQDGSDHRPVTLEAVLRISPPVEGGANFSFQWADPEQHSGMEAPMPASNILHEVCEEDDKDSDPEYAAA